ncbi:hypothetical protein XBFFL1_20003 [Xenorhabdus bovienii str. feltiae Florida]|nr:hypothetical protein XBFFL1_20003 [Xenorhabdus bovienii str. feltiae Florida]
MAGGVQPADEGRHPAAAVLRALRLPGAV